MRNPEAISNNRNNLEGLEDHESILESDFAKEILPYLTLDKLSDAKKADLLTLAKEATNEAIHTRPQEFDFFDFQKFYDQKIADLAGTGELWADGHFNNTTEQARKLFCASLLHEYNLTDDSWDKESIRSTFFGSSPDFASYCGTVSDSIELLTIGERSENNPCTRNIYDELVYDLSFDSDDGNILYDSFRERSPIQQLQFLPIFYNITMHCDTDSYTSNALYMTINALCDIEEDKQTAPLVKLVAERFENKITDYANAEYIYVDMDDPAYFELFEKRRRLREKQQNEQEKLHSLFPNFPEDATLIEMAPDTAASINQHGQINLVKNKVGDTASLLRYSEENSFGIDQDSAYLLGVAHNPNIKPLIDQKLGLNLADISLGSQIQLLKYMATADDSRFDSLCSTLNRMEPDLRLKLAEGFLAADFGEDFGDALLEITGSDNFKSEQVGEILDNIEGARKSIESITTLYKDFDDGEFAKEYTRAANERLTDAITVFSEIAKRGVAKADLDWGGKMTFDYSRAIEALQYETKSLEIISGTLSDVSKGAKGAFAEVVLKPEFDKARTFYNLYSPNHGYVLLYTRPEGAGKFDPMLEYGKVRSKYDVHSNNAGVEASISMITNPVDSFSLPNPYRPDRHKIKDSDYYDPATMDKVSAIRLDREGRAPGMPADDPDRDPINLIGTVSVDLAAIGDRADTPSGKIARFISAGNQLRATRLGSDSSLNHNTRWFDQNKYGTAKGFSDLVGYIDTLVLEWCKDHRPAAGEGFTGAMRNIKKQRGQKTLKRAA